MTEQMHHREMHVRAVNTDERTVTGIAVPYDEPTEISDWFGNYTEQFARGAVQDSDDALLYWRHSEPIGRIIANRDTDAGWEITARISQTPRGDEAYTLLRDGVVRSMSVGFRPVTTEIDDVTGNVTRTAVTVPEVSLVPMPAYAGADVLDVRHRQPQTPTPQQNRGEQTMTDDVLTRADLTALEDRFTDFERGLPDLIAQRSAAPVTDTRSAAQFLQALVRGDEATVSTYEGMMQRAYDGGVLADDGTIRPQWVGDLTRLIEDNSILSGLFSTGTLPSTGTLLEFGELAANTTQVGVQANEGDPLVYGNVKVKTRTAPVQTVGGYSTLSRQEIERSNVNMLDLTLRAMAIAAGRNKNVALRAFVAALRAKRVAADKLNARSTVTIADFTKYTAWVGGIIDAAGIFEDQGLALENLLVDKGTFKTLASINDSTGRPLMTISGTGVNAVGTVSPTTLGADLSGVSVRVDPKQADGTPQFINKQAVRAYNSPLASLTDSNVVNLTNAYSVYYYTAIADEIPGALVPVVKADPAAAAN
ncbi:HK97 family phage prohead protease [Curtobacterium sp. Csp2]|uniref:HK97 family phage prohead protease n=1 Tax=Curtobacterium sp. Csp2 TaxID=2495430 RepID=UPI0015808E47|nr:HK97 family phage prohead protease [Curtobacterium sp. Csp2]QKS15601.1 HK97 family phage prohead protease [Curtobacterium sp. Csp2]